MKGLSRPLRRIGKWGFASGGVVCYIISSDSCKECSHGQCRKKEKEEDQQAQAQEALFEDAAQEEEEVTSRARFLEDRAHSAGGDRCSRR
jgi:hypothetical protein